MAKFNTLDDYLAALNPDSPDSTPAITAQEIHDELALWSGAQFHFDNSATAGQAQQSSSNMYAAATALSLVPPSNYLFNANAAAGVPSSQGVGVPALSPLDFFALSQQTQERALQQQQLQQAGLRSSTTAAAATQNLFSQLNGTYNPLLNLLASHPGTPITATNPAVLMAPMSHRPAPVAVDTAFPSIAPHPTSSPSTAAAESKSSTVKPAKNPSPRSAAAKSSNPGGALTSPTKSRLMPIRTSAAASSLSATTTPSDPTGAAVKRDHDQVNQEAPDDEDQNHTEEDKRRRNTAASARFRAKKKLREQALERTAEEMTHKADVLEKRVRELETEIRWLRNLVTEKDPALLASLAQRGPAGMTAAQYADAGDVTLADNSTLAGSNRYQQPSPYRHREEAKAATAGYSGDQALAPKRPRLLPSSANGNSAST
ncbi:hypothetical protein IWQ60_003704 [Tieghemiomyces parasiticus]|uniref:BZIP domain-containing protein n=1 Tax=Tieghemiomyces parasiticus TaxID=78921 RepID=A0A9W8DZZ5_9FUNG|nr:hypothetical protein IWQ60_003704 [Tieghemiomyces parasiticus]